MLCSTVIWKSYSPSLMSLVRVRWVVLGGRRVFVKRVVLRRCRSKGLDEDSHLFDESKQSQRISNMSQRLRYFYLVFIFENR